MKTKSNNGCGSSTDLCQYHGFTRTKFFHGMLLTDEHLRAEQTYHREALKRLNRYLWGAGIVCGLQVRQTNGLCIKVDGGFALDCEGNAIEVCRSITIDLADACRTKYPSGCAPDEDPIVKYLVLRYAEVAAEPAPVLTPDDECTPVGEAEKCQASKYREGFCLELWDRCPHPEPCPDSTAKKGDQYGVLTSLWLMRGAEGDPEATRQNLEYMLPIDCMSSPPCPKCPEEDRAVALAKLTIKCGQNDVDVECGCRQDVWSGRFLQWVACQVLKNIDRVPKDTAGLNEQSQDLPTEQMFARRPVEALARTALEYALVADPIRELQAKVAKLEEQLGSGGRPSVAKSKSKDAKEP